MQKKKKCACCLLSPLLPPPPPNRALLVEFVAPSCKVRRCTVEHVLCRTKLIGGWVPGDLPPQFTLNTYKITGREIRGIYGWALYLYNKIIIIIIIQQQQFVRGSSNSD
jgi:hypothetical protein